MNNYNDLYEQWLENTVNDNEAHQDLLSIKDNQDEIIDRFYTHLTFGTAGLRGILGYGTNRMNKYTVGRATQGLSNYLNSQYKNPSVAIGYDSRIKSDEFACQSAEIFAANGIKTYLFPRLVPTPMVSYAVMRFGCQSGIVITASHNPSKYNGYKCYDPAGYQMTDEAANATYNFISKTDYFKDIKSIPYEEALSKGFVEIIGEDIFEEYYEACLKLSIHPEVIKDSDIKIIYSPLNGAGNIPVRTVLDRAGFKDIRVVKEQELPDGNFPTCPYPNPEVRQVFECALEMTKTYKADLIFATDPDADRIGTAILTNDEYVLLNGNEIGVLLINYILGERKVLGSLPANPSVVKSFVSSKLADKVCEKYGVKIKDVLTGFKYVGEHITSLENQGRKADFIMGFEESYGYLLGTHAKDKDAVAAALMICEMTAFYRNQGKTLLDVLTDLQNELGFYSNKQISCAFEGAKGMATMQKIMAELEKNPPAEIGGYKVEKIQNFNKREIFSVNTGKIEELEFPKSNILAYQLSEDHFVIIRPSGTEPKIKIYVTAVSNSQQKAELIAQVIGESMKAIALNER